MLVTWITGALLPTLSKRNAQFIAMGQVFD